jgi:hypothetical protein
VVPFAPLVAKTKDDQDGWEFGPALAIRKVGILFGRADSGAVPHGLAAGRLLEPSWPFFLEMWAMISVGILFLLGFQRINPRMDARWESPSWTRCPFVLKQPLRFFHFGAWYLMSVGLGSLIFGLSKTPTNWFWELPLSSGAGMWSGVWILSRLVNKSVRK